MRTHDPQSGGEVCGFPSPNIYWLRNLVSRESLQLATTQPLVDDADVYVEARVSHGKTFSVSAPNLDRFSIDLTVSGLTDAVHKLPTGYDFPNEGEVTLLHRFVGHGNREWTTDLEEYGFTLGVQGKLDDALGYDVHVAHVAYFRVRSVETGINLSIRASWNRAGRPPSMFALNQPESRYFVPVCDPLPLDDNGDPLCDTVHLVTAGNPDLGPDKLERLGIGATTTFGGFTFVADWFSINNTGLPAIANWQVVVDRSAAGNPLPGTLVERASNVSQDIRGNPPR